MCVFRYICIYVMIHTYLWVSMYFYSLNFLLDKCPTNKGRQVFIVGLLLWIKCPCFWPIVKYAFVC